VLGGREREKYVYSYNNPLTGIDPYSPEYVEALMAAGKTI
tara:strand:- start:797 stop:916 length:120 start_codon:yes stop_codon:yes gene_type:complete